MIIATVAPKTPVRKLNKRTVVDVFKFLSTKLLNFINKIEILFRIFCKKRNKAPFFLINCRSVKMLIYSILTSASTSAATSSTSSLKFSIINC